MSIKPAIAQLDPLPIIALIPPFKKQEITKNKWAIHQSQIFSEIKKFIKNIEVDLLPLYESQNSTYTPQYQKKHTIDICNKLRILGQLNKHYMDPFLEVYVSLNLATIYNILQIDRLSINMHDKSIRKIEAEIDRYHNLEPVNNSSLMSNGDFYLNFRERYWLHLLLARVQLNRALMQSSKLMHSEAIKDIEKSYINSLKGMLELLIYLLYQFLGILLKPSSTKQPGKIHKQGQIVKVQAEISSFEICCSLLYNSAYFQANKFQNNPDFRVLSHHVDMFVMNIKHIYPLNLNHSPAETLGFLPENIKQMRFTQLTKIPFMNYEEIIEKTISNDPTLVYSILSFWICQMFSYSIQNKFLQVNNSKKKTGQVSKSEHWQAKALENAYTYLKQARLYHQIKNMYIKTYGKANNLINQIPENEEEISDEQNSNIKNSHQFHSHEQRAANRKLPATKSQHITILIKEKDDKILFIRKNKNERINFRPYPKPKSFMSQIEDPRGKLLNPRYLKNQCKGNSFENKTTNVLHKTPSKKAKRLHRSIQTANQLHLSESYERQTAGQSRKKVHKITNNSMQIHDTPLENQLEIERVMKKSTNLRNYVKSMKSSKQISTELPSLNYNQQIEQYD